MSLLEDLLIMVGVLLDVFATMEIQGAMIAHIRKRTLFIACGVVAAIELFFYFAGYFICWFAAKSGYIQERLKDSLRVWDYVKVIAVSGFYTAAAGCVCALVGITVWHLIVIIVVISVLMVIMGLYTGLHFGFENKTIAYVIGPFLLWGVSIEILLHSVLEII